MMVSLEELDECMLCMKQAKEEAIIQDMRRILNDFLGSLTDRQMYIFVWRYYHCDPTQKIAKMLDMSESTVRRELASIRQGLKTCLLKEGYTYEV